MPRIPDTDFSSATNTPTVTVSLVITVYGSLILTAVGTYNGGTTDFIVRSNASFTSNGKTLTTQNCHIYAPSCTFTFNDAFVVGKALFLDLGTLVSHYNVTSAGYQAASGTTTNMGTNATTWAMTQLAYVAWSMAGTITNGGSATIALNYNSTLNTTFTGGTQTYNAITIIGTGTGTVTFSGAFTFASMSMSSAGARTIKFTKTTTYTCTTGFLSGSATGNITITSDDAATQFTLVKSGGGTVSCDYLTLDYSIGSPATTWYAGTHSTDGTHNTNWTFTDPPSGAAPRELALLGVGS
jgi:hypothetical protein